MSYEPMLEDEELSQRLGMRNRVNPVRKALGNALITLGGGTPKNDEDDPNKRLMSQYYMKQLGRDPEAEELKKDEMRSRIAERNNKNPLTDIPVIHGESGQKEFATGDSFLDSLNPQEQTLVKGITDYSLSPEKTFGLRNDLRAKYLSYAKQFDPNFDASQFNTRQKYKQELASTKGSGVGRTVVSLNTAVPHLSSLADAMKPLASTRFPQWNAIANFFKRATGEASPADVDTALNAVAGELSTVFKGTAGTDQEISSWKESFNPNGSSDQKAAFVKRGIDLLEGRLGALEGQYKQTMGSDAPDGTFMYPKTKSVFEKLRGNKNPSFVDGGGQENPKDYKSKYGLN